MIRLTFTFLWLQGVLLHPDGEVRSAGDQRGHEDARRPARGG